MHAHGCKQHACRLCVTHLWVYERCRACACTSRHQVVLHLQPEACTDHMPGDLSHMSAASPAGTTGTAPGSCTTRRPTCLPTWRCTSALWALGWAALYTPGSWPLAVRTWLGLTVGQAWCAGLGMPTRRCRRLLALWLMFTMRRGVGRINWWCMWGPEGRSSSGGTFGSSRGYKR
jgi:hypothetical protein